MLLALGALLKLVPAAMALPLLGTRRYLAVATMGVVGLLGLGVTATDVPLPRIFSAIRETLAFQTAIDPDWMVGKNPAPPWMCWLGFVRHTPLQWLTVIAAGLVPALRPSRETARGGMALLAAWLGADAAGFHVLYLPLAWPALLWLSVGSPWRTLLLAATGMVLGGLGPAAEWLSPEPRMVLFGLLLWVATLGRLLEVAEGVPRGAIEHDRVLREAGLATIGVAGGWLLAGAAPGDGPVAAPLPEGQTTPEGAGFIHASDRVPGSVKALGDGMDRPASTLARPGTIRALQLYLRRAPVLWTALAEQYPARADVLRARAQAAPAGELRGLSGTEVGAWLRAERAAAETLQKAGLELGELPLELEKAWASGLGEEAVVVPGEEVPRPGE